VIAYASRSLTKPEQAYSTTEKECLAVVWGIEKMRPYLEGYRFTVLTDHQSLKWLQAIKDPTGRLARWAIFLQQHDFDIRYRKGVLNRVADTLSRQPAATEDETTPEDLFALEDAPGCNWYNRMRQEVEKDPTAHPDYCIRNERLHRHFWDMSDSTEPELSDPWKLCVPKPARAAVLRECHDNPTAGHLGIAKTTARWRSGTIGPACFERPPSTSGTAHPANGTRRRSSNRRGKCTRHRTGSHGRLSAPTWWALFPAPAEATATSSSCRTGSPSGCNAEPSEKLPPVRSLKRSTRTSSPDSDAQ
jgi:hypothetical protein